VVDLCLGWCDAILSGRSWAKIGSQRLAVRLPLGLSERLWDCLADCLWDYLADCLCGTVSERSSSP